MRKKSSFKEVGKCVGRGSRNWKRNRSPIATHRGGKTWGPNRIGNPVKGKGEKESKEDLGRNREGGDQLYIAEKKEQKSSKKKQNRGENNCLSKSKRAPTSDPRGNHLKGKKTFKLEGKVVKKNGGKVLACPGESL